MQKYTIFNGINFLKTGQFWRQKVKNRYFWRQKRGKSVSFGALNNELHDFVSIFPQVKSDSYPRLVSKLVPDA